MRQKAERCLVALVPAFASQAARAYGYQRLADLVGSLGLKPMQARPFFGRSIGAGEIGVEIDQQSLTLVVLELDLPPPWRGEQDVHQKERRHQGNAAEYPDEVPSRCASHVDHYQRCGH